MTTKPKATARTAKKAATPAKKTATAPKTRKANRKDTKKLLPILRNDPWLEPYADAIEGRHAEALRKEKELTSEAGSLANFANAHRYFGLHREADGSWIFREWAPNASATAACGSCTWLRVTSATDSSTR